VLVGATAITANLHRFDDRPEAVVGEIQRTFARRVVVVGEEFPRPPHEHIDMFVAVLDRGTLLVGDPALALPFFDAREELGVDDLSIRGIGSFRREVQEDAIDAYERIVVRLRAAGFAVRRVPILHDDLGELLTWTNAVVESRDGRRRAYVPGYGVPFLDERAHACWARAGFKVLPNRADRIIAHGGAVRCLSNVIR